MNPDKLTLARNREIARIFCLARELGTQKDHLNTLSESVTGEFSIKKLSKSQRSKLIRHLVGMEKKSNKKTPGRNQTFRGKGVFVVPTAEQHTKVNQLLATLAPLTDIRDQVAYRESLSKRNYKKSYATLSFYQMQKFIETLKKIITREKNQ